MANIFAVLTAIALAASAYLAFKNKAAYTAEIEQRQQAESDLKRSQERLAGLQQDRDSTIAEREETEQATVVLGEQVNEQEATNAAIQSEITKKGQLRDTNEAKITEVEDKLKDIDDIENIGRDMKRLGEELATLRDDRDGKKAVLANLISERASTQKTIDGYSEINAKHSNQVSYGNTRISAIYGPWGFVTLSNGNSSGIVSGSTLDVVRGGEVVAKLRVRSVESGRASADVIPDSLAEGESLRVGDKAVPSTSAAAAN